MLTLVISAQGLQGTRDVAPVRLSSRQFLKCEDSSVSTREITDICQGEEEDDNEYEEGRK
jgi:hypothetical protein